MRMLQSEVTKLKDILARLLEDISISLPLDIRTEMQTSVDMPEIVSPGRTFLQPASGMDGARDDGDTSEVSYSDQNDYGMGGDKAICRSSESSGFLSRLSSSNWSARISTKLNYENCHEKIKGCIP